MNHFIKLTFTIILFFSACTENKTQEDHQDATAIKEVSKSIFEGISFASKIDTICGMPVNTKTVEDTLMVDGKIYGFCAVECKQEFIKQLQEKNVQ